MTVTTGARGSASRVGVADVFLEEGFRIVELGGERLVAHFLDDDHRRLLVELLVDGDHLAQLHQLLDDLGRLDRHLVREFGDA